MGKNRFMKNAAGRFLGVATIVFLLLGFLSLAGSANAQTKKKKKKTTTTRTPKPVPLQTMPTIVSTADQYSNQNQQIVTGNYETPTQTETQTQAQPETFDQKLDRINTRLQSLESTKPSSYDEKQKRLLTNIDILTRAEQRTESLRKQLFELMEKENAIQTKLDTIDYDLRPEMIERYVAQIGGLRPEELRDSRRKTLEGERNNLNSLLTQIQNTRTNLEANLLKADQMVERLRAVLEKDIDNALTETEQDQPVRPRDQ
jgi:hypothetical protein